MSHLKNLTLKVWRQSGPTDSGHFETYNIDEISDEASFLELLDVLNERLISDNKEAVVFDHDCREGICGTCSLMINGVAHGPQRATTTCQLHMRSFKSDDTIVVEPWRATAFPIIKDLMVDRSPLDRIIESGGFITAVTGGAPDGNLIPIQWTRRSALAVARALLRALTAPQACLPVQKLLTSIVCRRVKPSATSERKQWWKQWTSTLVRAPITANVRRPARRKSLSTSLRS